MKPQSNLRILFAATLFFIVLQAHSADLEDSLKDLSASISEQLVQKRIHKVAVVGFSDLNGYRSALGDFVSEEMVTALISAGGYDVVERRELDRVLSEQSGYTEGIFDLATTAELQKLLGIDALITGSITDLGNRVKVNARAISVETARAIAAASVSIQKDDTINQLMSQVAATSGTPANSGSPGFKVQSSDTFFKNRFLHIVPTSASISSEGNELRIATEVRNISNEELVIAFLDQSAEALSDAGDDFRYSKVSGISNLRKYSTKTEKEKYSTIDAGSHAVVVWTFKVSDRKAKIVGRTFSFGAQLFRLTTSGPKSFSVGLSGLQL